MEPRRIKQWFPTGEEFLPREEFHDCRGGISTFNLSYLFIVRAVFLFRSWHWRFQLVESRSICVLFCGIPNVFVYALYCHYLTKNSFYPTLLTTLLLSIKTIVPIAVNTSLQPRTEKEWKFHRGGMKIFKVCKGRKAWQRLVNTGIKPCEKNSSDCF